MSCNCGCNRRRWQDEMTDGEAKVYTIFLMIAIAIMLGIGVIMVLAWIDMLRTFPLW